MMPKIAGVGPIRGAWWTLLDLISAPLKTRVIRVTDWLGKAVEGDHFDVPQMEASDDQ